MPKRVINELARLMYLFPLQRRPNIKGGHVREEAPRITVDLSGVDWALLRRQKDFLIDLKNEDAEGLLSLIDTIQDQAAEILGEKTVFGPPSER